MYVCMYVCILALPLCSQVFPEKNTVFPAFSQRGRPTRIEFFQIFGKRMQEAQASKKAGRGNRAWDPCFAKTTFSGTSSNCRAVRWPPPPNPPPPQKTYVIDLSSSKYPTRRAMLADMQLHFVQVLPVGQLPQLAIQKRFPSLHNHWLGCQRYLHEATASSGKF